MANSNFVVHNGLSVGPTTIDAASGNISIPVGKHITIGNVILRDNGTGRLAVRDITDNSDVIIDATVDAGSTTSGNIQIGTNHIESTNANGPISIRPNGAGNIAIVANTIMVGKGGAYTLIGTGIQTDAAYGINYTPSNIIVQTSGALSSGNVRIDITTAASSKTTGALQVMGGLGVVANVWASYFNGTATTAQYADLAENYTGDASYEPGTVVHFGGEQEVTQCDADMCTRVAGVVSTNPAYLMNTTQLGEHIVPVALTGRVPTKVTGTVTKGDMMVSAGNGRARAEANPKVGSVIGKALTNSEGDTVIEVVIGKH